MPKLTVLTITQEIHQNNFSARSKFKILSPEIQKVRTHLGGEKGGGGVKNWTLLKIFSYRIVYRVGNGVKNRA